MLGTLPKKSVCTLFFLLAFGCGKESRSREPGAEPSPPQSDNITAGSPRPDVWSERRRFRVNWAWDTAVKAEALVSAVLTFVTPEGKSPNSVAQIEIDPWMPSMGHGTATVDQVIVPAHGRPGVFQINGLYFIMGGPWEIRIRATVDGSEDRAALKVNVE